MEFASCSFAKCQRAHAALAALPELDIAGTNKLHNAISGGVSILSRRGG